MMAITKPQKQPQKQSLEDKAARLCDLDAESCLIATLLLEPTMLVKIASVISPFDFYDQNHSAAYRACMELHQNNKTINLVTVAGRLKASKATAPDNGWSDWLYYTVDKLDKTEGYSHHTGDYAEIVKGYSTRRKLANFTTLLAEKVHDLEVDPQNLLEYMTLNGQKIVQWWNTGKQDNYFMTKEQSVDALFEVAYSDEGPNDNNELTKGLTGQILPRFGFDCLDGIEHNTPPKVMLLPSTVTVIMADTGGGKTALGDQVVANNEEAGIACAVYGNEISNQDDNYRRACRLAELDFYKFVRNSFTPEEREKVSQAAARVAQWPGRKDRIFCPGWTIEQIIADFKLRTQTLELQTGQTYRVLVLDYLQKVGGENRFKTQAEHFTHVMNRFADLSNEMNVAGIVMVQQKRDGNADGKNFVKPTLHGGLGTSAIEQRCNQMIGIWPDRTVQGAIRPVKLIGLKSTFGEPGWEVDLEYYASRFEFGE